MAARRDGRVYTVGEAAAVLGIGETNLRRWILRADGLRARRRGGIWLISRKDLDNFRRRWQESPAVRRGKASAAARQA